MVKKLNLQFIRKTLLEKNIDIFSPLEFKRIFGVSDNTSHIYIHRQLANNFFVKLRNGLYSVSDNLPTEMQLANRLYHPSYISFEYALSYYHIIPESVYAVASATAKSSRRFISLEKNFIYHKLKKEYFTGYTIVKLEGKSIFIATLEKAFIDYLYFVYIQKKELFDRIFLKDISVSKLNEYLKLYNKDFRKFVKEIYDRFKNN